MLTLPDYFYEINFFSVAFRLVLAVIFSGVIGLERGANRHPAGFRTYILVCVGAALAMLTNQYIYQVFGQADVARLGAQVITGVGFLGVGTILVTGGGHKIKGLTTAAGLWASACLGLALGIGFYDGALVAAVIIFVSLALLPKVENYFYKRSRVIDLYLEVDTAENFRDLMRYIRSIDSGFYETRLNRTASDLDRGITFHLSMRLPKGMSHNEIVDILGRLDGVYAVEEI